MMTVQGLGSPTIPFSSPTTPQQPRDGTGDEAVRTPQSSFHCRHGSCTKVFRRKEHLNRHERSHEPMRPHKCYLCNKSFARKDILHRHVLLHNAPPGEGPKRTLLACKTCRRRKIRCDSNVPCSACEAAGLRCVRTPSSSQNVLGRRQQQRPGGVQSGLLGQDSVEDEDEDACEDDAEAEAGEDGQYDYFEPGWNDKPDNDNNVANLNSSLKQHSQTPSGEVICSPMTSTSPSWSWSGIFLQAGQPLSTPPSGQTPPSSLITPDSLATPRFFTNQGSLTTPWSGAPYVYGGESHWQSKSSRSAMTESFFRDVPTPGSGDVSGMDDLMVWMNQAHLEAFFHGLWPLLHLPTLNMETATPALVHALGQFQSWIQQKSVSDAILCDIEIHSNLLQSLIQSMSSDMWLSSSTNHTITLRSFQTVQALGLIAACAITGNNPPDVFEWVVWCAAMCIAYLRQMGVFEGARKIDQVFNLADERWIMEEQFNRLAANFLRIDAYLSLMLGRAPTLRWSEMRFTFPASDVIWRAAKPEERRILLWHEPAGRYSTSFRTVIREGLMQVGQSSSTRPRHLLMDDYNLALCAFASNVWEVAQEARYHDHRNYQSPAASTDAAEGIRVWQSYLLDMRHHMEMNHDLETTFFAPGHASPSPSSSSTSCPASPPLSPSATGDVSPSLAMSVAATSLTLYHLLHVNLVTDVPVLETAKCCEECQDLGLPMRMRMWALGPDARRAVVHAAQLRRIYARETATGGYATHLSPAELRISNPLRPVSLLVSAVVLCFYAHRAPCLHPHRPGGEEPLELARPEAAGRAHPVLDRWICDGHVTTAAGVALMGLSLCPCALPTLTAWYRDQFAPGSAFAQRFQKFEVLLRSFPC